MDTVEAPALVRLAGVGIELVRLGRGRPIVFFHSHTGPEASRPLLEHLAESGEVIAPSHPGFGRSELPRTLTTIDDLAYFYLDAFDELNLRDVTLVGSSFGAWIAMEMAIKDTSRLSSLVLIGAVGAKFGPREKSDVLDIFSTPRARVEALCYHDQRHALTDASGVDEATLEAVARHWDSTARFAWTPYMHDPKLRSRLHRVRRPTLVLWGAEDRIAPLEHGREYANAIPGARFETIEAAGHFAHVDRPEAVAARIAAFVKAHS